MQVFYEHLGADPKDPEVFTILATDYHKDFPPTYITSCEFDPLRDDAYVLEAALKEAGVPTKHDHVRIPMGKGSTRTTWSPRGVLQGSG